MDFVASTTAALDPLLTREGFAAGQGGGSEIIYCAGHDDVSDRFPRLPQADAQARGHGYCIDLVIEHRDPGLEVALEGESLAKTLRDLQLHEAALSIDEIRAMPLADALCALVEVLPQLFRAAEP